ncbi:unnamed protein product [Leptosia nina]|uniref:Uncharacterized protein n=1 Tax=Leptosia nina TaxID=320188 RepID=A0AAV1JLB1_9NEOP
MGYQSSKDQITYNSDSCLNQNEADQLGSLILEELRWTRDIAMGQMILIMGVKLIYGILETLDRRMRALTSNTRHNCNG